MTTGTTSPSWRVAAPGSIVASRARNDLVGMRCGAWDGAIWNSSLWSPESE